MARFYDGAAATVVGPLINSRQVVALMEQVDAALSAGAKALLEGTTEGNVVSPVVLEGVTVKDDIARGELFGQVVLIMEFDGDDQAVARWRTIPTMA